MLIEQTTVPDAALPVDAFKAHLRLGSGFGQDDVQDPVVTSFLRAAIAAVEARTAKALIARDFGLTLDFWRHVSAQTLPMSPVNEILSVTMRDRDGSETTMDAELFWLEQSLQRPRLRSSGATLPRIPRIGTVRVAFRAGFGDAWEDVPADLRQAVMMLAAHYYEYRNDTALSDGCMPFGVTSLIERYKPVRLGGGA